MHQTLAFIEQHGAAVVFLAVLLEQLGVPIPAAPVLLAAGALAGAGKFSAAAIIALAALASLISDFVWYRLGRARGQSILNLLCRLSLEPDSCVSSTRGWFQRLGASSLLIAKFVPGLSTAAPPMAGATLMPAWKFLVFDGFGSLVWSGAFVGLGVAFNRQLESVLAAAARFGISAALLIAGGLLFWLAFKLWRRYRFLNSLRSARVHPDDLLIQLGRGDPMAILDLRHPDDLETDLVIPGAIRFGPDSLAERHHEIPRDRDIVLYCS